VMTGANGWLEWGLRGGTGKNDTAERGNKDREKVKEKKKGQWLAGRGIRTSGGKRAIIKYNN